MRYTLDMDNRSFLISEDGSRIQRFDFGYNDETDFIFINSERLAYAHSFGNAKNCIYKSLGVTIKGNQFFYAFSSDRFGKLDYSKISKIDFVDSKSKEGLINLFNNWQKYTNLVKEYISNYYNTHCEDLLYPEGWKYNSPHVHSIEIDENCLYIKQRKGN